MIYQSYGSFQRKASFLNAVTSSRRVSPACSTSLFLSRAHVLACSFVEGERHCYHAGNMLRTSHSKSQWYLVKHQCREWTFTCYHYLGLLKGEGLERPIEWSLLDHLRMVDEGEEDGRVCLDQVWGPPLEGDGTRRTLGLGPPSMPFKCSGSFFFSDQRHMKHVCIFYKLETQGITLQLEDQKAGEGRLHGRRSWTQIPESTVLTPAHLTKIFLSFSPFFFLFFSSLLSVSFRRPLSWTFHGTFWEQGWPRKECLFEWVEPTWASQCNFPLCGSALKSEVVRCTQWPRLPYLNTL